MGTQASACRYGPCVDGNLSIHRRLLQGNCTKHGNYDTTNGQCLLCAREKFRNHTSMGNEIEGIGEVTQEHKNDEDYVSPDTADDTRHMRINRDADGVTATIYRSAKDDKYGLPDASVKAIQDYPKLLKRLSDDDELTPRQVNNIMGSWGNDIDGMVNCVQESG